jgi:uncharacterized protein YicC (UPF0701 family)
MNVENGKIGVRITRKYNLDHYESLDVEASLVGVTVEAGDDLDSCYLELFNLVRRQIKAQALPSLIAREKQRRSELSEVVNGLPRALADAGRAALEATLPEQDLEGMLNDVMALAEKLNARLAELTAEYQETAIEELESDEEPFDTKQQVGSKTDWSKVSEVVQPHELAHFLDD